ncbi:hypothetical protein O3P69_004926 [Scylla paramamosain]|uniref:C2H2-type domain-containing protein n=1 Tax=Scylla paramamosain TaxID=85552 RepID=A0AAW0UCR4_SCYPA
MWVYDTSIGRVMSSSPYESPTPISPFIPISGFHQGVIYVEVQWEEVPMGVLWLCVYRVYGKPQAVGGPRHPPWPPRASSTLPPLVHHPSSPQHSTGHEACFEAKMKPGGLCPPGDGRALPPGDGVGLPHKLSDACAQFPKGPATPREGQACLTPDLYEEGRQGSRPAHSPLNGHLGQEALLNGAFHRDCQVLSPPQSEDGDEDGAHPSPVGPRPGGMRPQGAPDSPTAVPPTLPSICGKRYEQLTVITAEPRGRGGTPLADPTTPSPGSSALCSPSPGQQGSGLGRGVGLTSPRGCKGQRGRRKCSLEEVMSKLHSRHGTHTLAGQNALQNFPLTDRLLGVHQAAPRLGEGGCDRTVTLPSQHPSPTTPTTSVCDTDSVAPLPGIPPVGQAVQGPGLRTSRPDTSPGAPSVRTPSVVSDSVAAVVGLAAAAAAATDVDTTPQGVPGAPPSPPRQDPTQDTEQPTDTDRNAPTGPDRGVACAPAVLNPPVSPKGLSSCPAPPTETPMDGRATAVPDGVDVGGGEGERGMGSPVEEVDSGRSSSVEVLEGEAEGERGCGSQASESDIEVLFDSTGGAAASTATITTTTTTTTTTTATSVEKAVKSTVVATAPPAAAAAAGSIGKVLDTGRVGEGQGAALLTLPGMVGGAPFLEPISDDENSLLTSDLSSVSGALSNSNTPMFSDTPSDASRGALMVKISDAVAAILSDVSDDSLPDSPLASSSNSTDGFPSARQQAERLSRKISSICDKLEQDCGREGGTAPTPAPRPALGGGEGEMGVSSDGKDGRTSPPRAPCPLQPPAAETVFPLIQKQAAITTTTTTTTPPLPSVDGEDGGKEQQAAVTQSGGDLGPGTEAEAESVVPSDPSDSVPQPPSSAPAVPCTLSPDSPTEGPGPPPHVPHTDLGTNYCSRSMDADNNPCQNHISGSQTISSQTRFCNIHPGDVTQPPAGASPPGPQAEAPQECPIPQGHHSPTPGPAGSTTPAPCSPQTPATPEEEARASHSHAGTEAALCDAGNSEAPTLLPSLACAGVTQQESATHYQPQASTVPPTTATTTTTTPQDTEQSSSEGTLLPSSECTTITIPPPDTPLTSDAPQQETPGTESPPQHTAPAECPVSSPSGVEPLGGDEKCAPPDSSDGPGQCEVGSSSGSEGCVLAAEPTTTTTTAATTKSVVEEGEEGCGGDGCRSEGVVRSGGDTQVPGSVAVSAMQHPATSPHTPVPLTCPAEEETGPAGGSQDLDTPATSVPPAPTPPGCPDAPQALCSLGEATNDLLVSGSPGVILEECEVREDAPCTSPCPVTDPSPAPGEEVTGDTGASPHDSPSEPASPKAEATDGSPHSPSPHVAAEDATHTPQPELLACLGLERRHPRQSPRPSEEVSVALTQGPDTSDMPRGQQEDATHQEVPLQPAQPPDNIPTATTATNTLPPPPDLPATPEDAHTCVLEEDTHHTPQNTATTTTPQPPPQQEESVVAAAAAECDVSVPACPRNTPETVLRAHSTKPKQGPPLTSPLTCPSVKSPTVGVTPDEVTIPQGEPHTGLASEHPVPPSYVAQGVGTLTGKGKGEVQGVGAEEVTPSDPCHEESQTACDTVTQDTQDTTAATEEGVHSAVEDTTTKPDTSVPHQPHTTDTTMACCATDSDLQQRQAIQGQPEGALQLSLDLVKKEVLHGEEDTSPSLTDKAEVEVQDIQDVQGRPSGPAGRVASTEAHGTPGKGESTEVSGALCPLCGEALAVPLERHLTIHHICCTFVPAKTTLAYRHHMLQRVTDAPDLPPGEDLYADSLFVCRSCCFVSYDINAVRFHLNIHEEVYQARPGREDCACDRRSYSYPSHKWRSLMHHSSHHCHLCGHYFACQEGHASHTLALHFPAQRCPVCGCEVPLGEAVQHLAGHQGEPAAPDTQQDESSSVCPPDAAPSPTDRFGVSWNIYDNCINFLDGKDFRLGTAPKVVDPSLDRSYLALPLSNVEEEAVVPPHAILDPGHDIHRYLKNKRVVRIPGGGEDALRSFSLAVQLDLHKKMNRKGRKGPAERPRAARREDLFTVLGIQVPRARPPAPKQPAHPTPPRTPGRKPRRKPSLEIPLGEPSSDGPQLTRTRSGMMQAPRGEGVAPGGREEPTTPVNEGAGPSAAEVHGEWSREHTYVCCSCGASCLNLADMMDHKWEMHPAVWCAHTMLEGQGLVPHGFRNQFQPPTARPCVLPLPTAAATTPKVEAQPPSGTPHPEATATHTCTSCHSIFQDIAAFHTHLVECGGLSLVSVSKKKTKKGFRFKRRKGQGMPSNRYGNTSQPTTPLKARTGDRSSGLNTPLSDRPSALSLPNLWSQTAPGLKNRLKAIITNTRGPLGGTSSHPGRRPKMKLRKKALDTRRLRKTRHSDRVKEQRAEKTEKEEKVEVSAEDGKGKAGKKGTATTATTTVAPVPEAPKQVKGKEAKKKGKKGKKKSVKSEEDLEGVSSPSGTAPLDVEDKKKVKTEVVTDVDASLVTEKLQRVNGYLSKTKKIKKKKKIGGKVMVAEKKEEKVPLVASSITPAPPTAAEKKGKGKKAAGKRKVMQSEGVTEVDTEKPVKGAKKTTKIMKSEKRQLEESEAPAPSTSPLPPPQEASIRPRKVRRTSSVETNTSSVKEEEEEEEETETTAGDEDEEEGGEWNSDSKDCTSRIRDALRPKRQAYFSSSSEDTENSDDSEPEVIRNFRSGRGCSGRMGLRTKRSQGSSRGAAGQDEGKTVDGVEEEGEKEEEVEELPLTPRRKRKIANYENQDDYTYVPHESSSDVDYMEASDDEATSAAAPKRESPRLGRSKRRSTRLSSKTSSSGSRTHQQEEEEEGMEAGSSKASLPEGTAKPSPQNESTWEELAGEAAGNSRVDESVAESPSASTSSVCSTIRSRRRSLEVPREAGPKVQKAPRTASAPSSDLEGEVRCASKASKRKGVALLERLALSSSFQAQVDEVAGKTQRRKKAAPATQSDFKDTDEECVQEAIPGDSEPSTRPLRRNRYILSENSASDSQARDRDLPLKPLRRNRYLLSENSASDSQALESDSSMDKPHPLPLARRRNVIVSSDEAEAQLSIPAKTAAAPETPTEDAPDDPPQSPAKKMRPAKKTQTKTDPGPIQQTSHAPEEEDDEDDNVPLSTLAHLNRKQDVTATSPAPRKTVAVAVAARQKASSKSKKRLKVRQLNRLIKESAAQDSESSSFEGFSSTPSQRWGKAKAPTKKYKKKQSLLKAKPLHFSSTASESEASDEPRATRKTKKLGASPLITAPGLTEGEVGAAPPQWHGKAPTSHKKKAKSSKKYKKKGGKGLGGAGKDSLKGNTIAPHSMPVLECMVDMKAGQEEGQHTPPSADASTEPAAVKDHQPPADPPKDTPVVTPTQQPPDLLPATTNSLEEQAAPLASLLPQDMLAPPVESPSKAPQSRKKRIKSTQEAVAKDKASGGGEPLPPSSPPPPPPPPVSPAEHHTKMAESIPSPKKAGKRKRSVSVCGAAGQEAPEAGRDGTAPATTTSTTTTTASPVATTPKTTAASKKNGESAKKKKSSSGSKATKIEVNELTCTDCGLKFGSLASLEDHRQDCLTIAFEMSMMEAEDHLFECPHCHLTFAKKGTQRKHTTSCRLVKYKRYESKAFKKASRGASTTPALLLPVGDTAVVAPPPLPSPGKGSKSSKENISGEVLPGAPDPMQKEVKEVLRVPVYGRNTDKMGTVLVGGNTLQENIKNLEPLQRVAPLSMTDATPKARREPQQLNGRLLNGEHLDPFPTSPVEESPRCGVCGYETSDPDVLAKHRLILQFSRYCQQQTVKEVCALAANYNLGLDAVRGMVSAATTHQGFITLAFDPKQPPVSTLSSLVGAAASTTAKLKEVLASPHCARVLSSLESLAKHYQTSDAVDITGTKQDTLKTVAILEEVLKDISEADNALLRNRMLKSMRETFEAGTLN